MRPTETVGRRATGAVFHRDSAIAQRWRFCGLAVSDLIRGDLLGFKARPFDQSPAGYGLNHQLRQSPSQGVNMIWRVPDRRSAGRAAGLGDRMKEAAG